MENIINELNPAQREAVVNFTGPGLIVAGAGSGKTRVLTSRIAYMIASGVAPHNILALTFTNKAAAEMRDRIEGMSGRGSRYINMGTFHSVFLRILRTEAERIGYPPAFTIYDTTDSISLVKSICRDMSLADNDKYKPRSIFARISRLKNDLVTPAAYQEDSFFTAEDRKRGCPQFLEIYKRYTAGCRANGAMDFDDLLLNMVVLLKNNPDVLEKYRDKFRYILVDEYQDTNHVQYLIVKALGAEHRNICVVGDDSQSIYSFRGARIENILNFKRDFPEAKVYKLEQNYRSTQTIVNAANSVISRNSSSRELKKECFSAGERGERIRIIGAYTDREEAEMVAAEIRALGRGGSGRGEQAGIASGDRAPESGPVQWSDIAVLYRVNALSRGIEESLRRREVPYKIYRGHSFFDRKEIKDLLAYFRLVVNPRDDEAFKRIINYPARGIGEVTVGRIAAAAREKSASMWETVEAMAAEAVTTEEKTLAKRTAAFAGLIRSLALERPGKSLYEFGREVATRSGILGSFKAEGSAESISALENIDELLNSMEVFRQQKTAEALEEGTDPEAASSLEEWLGSVALMSDMDNDEPENRNKVTLMTVHSAKGLEFRHVFIVGLEEELFPSIKDGDSQELEEERRLFYVALTRAKERSYLSMAQTRFIHGNMAFRRTSRFVREIDEQFLDGAPADGRGDGGPGSNGPSAGRWSGGRADRADGRSAQRGGNPAWEARDRNRESGNSERPAWQQGGRTPYPARRTAEPEKVAPVAPEARFRKIGGNPSRSAAVSPAATEAPASAAHRAPEGAPFRPGMRVAHARFGRGTVQQVESAAGGGGAQDLKIVVMFDDGAHGRKTLLSKFARLEIV